METLILIDIQNDYFEDGANELVGSNLASLNAKQVLQYFRTNKLPVIHVKHISIGRNSTYFLEGTPGADFHQNVEPIDGEQIFIKHFPNAFRETFLEEYLNRINATDLVICGMMTHMCIDSSVRAARDFGYTITLIGDACATMDLTWGIKLIPANIVQSVYLSALRSNFSPVIETKQFLLEMEERNILKHEKNYLL